MLIYGKDYKTMSNKKLEKILRTLGMSNNDIFDLSREEMIAEIKQRKSKGKK